jgi:hypothetical protein
MQNIESIHASKFSKATLTEKLIIEEQLIVRINGTLPDFSTRGNEEKHNSISTWRYVNN